MSEQVRAGNGAKLREGFQPSTLPSLLSIEFDLPRRVSLTNSGSKPSISGYRYSSGRG